MTYVEILHIITGPFCCINSNIRKIGVMVPNFKEISILSKEMKCISIHCFALTESDIDNAPIAVCRNFVPLYSINEEAATGTSNYALACYLHNLGIRTVFQKVCKSFLFSSLQIYSFLIK